MYLPRSNLRRILALTLPGGISLGVLLYALVTQLSDPTSPLTVALALLFGGVIGIALSVTAWLSLRYALEEARRHAVRLLNADLPPLDDRDPLVGLRQTVTDAISAVPRAETIAGLAERLRDAGNYAALLAAVAESLAEHLPARGAVLLLHDAERGVLTPTVAWGVGNVDRTVTFDINGSAIGRAVRERRSVTLPHVQMRGLLAASAPIALTVISWPLWAQDVPLGALCLIIAGADARLNESQQHLIEQATALLTVTLQTQVYRQWVDREQRRLAAFDQVMNNVAEQPDLERALAHLLRIAAEVTDSNHGTLLLIDPDTMTIKTRITLSGGDMLPRNLATAPILKLGLAGWTLRARRGAIIDDVERDTRWIPTPGLELMRSALAMPLFHGDRPLGVLTLADPTPSRYSQRSLALVAALAAHAVAILVRHRYEGLIEPLEQAQARQVLSLYLGPEMIRELVAQRAMLMQAVRPQTLMVTVVYVCLRGIERVSGLTAHQLIEQIAAPLHAECRAVVYGRQGAYVASNEQSFCAVFGFPRPRFDDAARALQTAWQLQETIARLRLQWCQQTGAELTMAAGVTTGQLAVGMVEHDHSAMLIWTGAAMRDARRLAQLARSDEIMVADSVLKTIQPAQFSLEPLTPVSLHNGDEPVSVYRLAACVTK
ncbi:GAF domain-containing protein [Chloroflexus sp.]|uniref:GAF domain-containing protein n=1 Tax=Chloroflexus sp. TaxID=1904827 RepID=UPI00262B9CC9|nr:GAF domain-containing protein [uncultured Chloroflexus sp.]